MAKEIELTRGLKAVVDDSDFEFLNQWKWYALKGGGNHNRFYAARSAERGSKKITLMHRSICAGTTEPCVDHRDGNGLNNRRKNLRPCSRSQNGQNRRKLSRINSRIPTGVHRIPRKKYICWQATIRLNQKHKHLGFFKTMKAAHTARLAAEKVYFGEFSLSNSRN